MAYSIQVNGNVTKKRNNGYLYMRYKISVNLVKNYVNT